VPERWHDAYAKGEAGFEGYMDFVVMME